MNYIISEKDYPIEKKWVIKEMAFNLLLLLFVLIYFYFTADYVFLVYAALILFRLIYTVLSYLNFHYEIAGSVITIKEGILNKKQRSLPYGVIQNIIVKQGLLEKLIGLASLSVENASQGGVFKNPAQTNNQNIKKIGVDGNKINIPGLTKENAEKLKEILLQKIKTNQIDDSSSGL